ncbi:hypothetical protein SDJN03_15365, partial [Cucurbita argyrosperma subsp. sororia]
MIRAQPPPHVFCKSPAMIVASIAQKLAGQPTHPLSAITELFRTSAGIKVTGPSLELGPELSCHCNWAKSRTWAGIKVSGPSLELGLELKRLQTEAFLKLNYSALHSIFFEQDSLLLTKQKWFWIQSLIFLFKVVNFISSHRLCSH